MNTPLSSCSSSGRCADQPALLTTPPRPPSASTVAPTPASTEPVLVTFELDRHRSTTFRLDLGGDVGRRRVEVGDGNRPLRAEE